MPAIPMPPELANWTPLGGGGVPGIPLVLPSPDCEAVALSSVGRGGMPGVPMPVVGCVAPGPACWPVPALLGGGGGVPGVPKLACVSVMIVSPIPGSKRAYFSAEYCGSVSFAESDRGSKGVADSKTSLGEGNAPRLGLVLSFATAEPLSSSSPVGVSTDTNSPVRRLRNGTSTQCTGRF